MPKIEDAKDTGSPLRRRRIECGVSLRSLARETGVPVTRIQRLEHPEATNPKKVEPRISDLALLAWALGVELEHLIDHRWRSLGGHAGEPTPRRIWKADPPPAAWPWPPESPPAQT